MNPCSCAAKSRSTEARLSKPWAFCGRLERCFPSRDHSFPTQWFSVEACTAGQGAWMTHAADADDASACSLNCPWRPLPLYHFLNVFLRAWSDNQRKEEKSLVWNVTCCTLSLLNTRPFLTVQETQAKTTFLVQFSDRHELENRELQDGGEEGVLGSWREVWLPPPLTTDGCFIPRLTLHTRSRLLSSGCWGF